MRFLFALLPLLLLAACSTPPAKKPSSVGQVPVIAPAPTPVPVVKPDLTSENLIGTPEQTIDPGIIEPEPMAEHISLPAGWSVIDPKEVLAKVEYDASLGGALLTLQPDAGLEVFSALDLDQNSYYKGRVNNAHVIALPTVHSSVLVVFMNRQNKRTSVLLKRSTQ